MKLFILSFLILISCQTQPKATSPLFTPQSYDRSVDQELMAAFGQPHLLDKKKFQVVTEPNISLRKGKMEGYAYLPSIKGNVDYILSRDQEAYREKLRKNNRQSLANLIRTSLGVDQVPLGKQVHLAHHREAETRDYTIDQVDLKFQSGAVAQFLIGIPKEVNNQTLMLAVHGCSSSPDKVMGIGKADYTNQFGLEALKQGYTVVAPYVLNLCDWIDDIDALGGISSGTTLYGLEVMKIQKIVDYVMSQNPQLKNKNAYGISLGGYLVLYSAILDQSYQKLILSGITYDYRNYLKGDLLPFHPMGRTRFSDQIFRFVNIEDLIISLFPRKIVLELGSYDVKKDAIAIVDNIKKFLADSQKDLFKINFFKGYHETNPRVSLDLIKEN